MGHIVILAAGRASRYGEPKQLIDIDGVSLVNRTLNSAAGVQGKTLHLVLGAYKDEIRQQLNSDINLIIAKDWHKGLARSIAAAVIELYDCSDHLMFVLADQIDLDSDTLSKLWQQSENAPDKIICASYGEIDGPPVIFPKAFYNELIRLEGDSGAKSLLAKYKNQLLNIDLPAASVDIDTKHDLEAWKRHQDQSDVN